MKAARKFNKNLTTDDMVTVNVLGSDYFYPSDDAQNYRVSQKKGGSQKVCILL